MALASRASTQGLALSTGSAPYLATRGIVVCAWSSTPSGQSAWIRYLLRMTMDDDQEGPRSGRRPGLASWLGLGADGQSTATRVINVVIIVTCIVLGSALLGTKGIWIGGVVGALINAVRLFVSDKRSTKA